MPPEWLAAGTVGRPHGLDGSFHVIRARAEGLERGAGIRVGGTDTEITRRAGTPDRPILRVAAAGTREAIEALRGAELTVPRDAAPPLGEDEWWAEDLVGCAVVDGAASVGEVRRLLALPSCEVLEVARADGADLLVPLVRDAVRSVDVAARTVDVDLGFLGEAT